MEIGGWTCKDAEVMYWPGTLKAKRLEGDGSKITNAAGDNLGNHIATKTVSGANMYMSGNVGIGAPTPRGQVDITSATDAYLYFDGNDGAYFNIISATDPAIYFSYDKILSDTVVMSYDISNYVGYGPRWFVFRPGIRTTGFIFSNKTNTPILTIASSACVGVGTKMPRTSLDVSGGLIVDGTFSGANSYMSSIASAAFFQGDGSDLYNVSATLPSYDTGWINRSDWTNVHMGTSAAKNADSNVTHLLSAALSQLLVKVLISTDGTDGNSFEPVIIDSAGTAVGGINVFEVNSDNIKVQTGTDGIRVIFDDGTSTPIIATDDWYYKVVVYKLT